MSSGIILGHLTFALLIFLLLPTKRLPLRLRYALLAGLAALSLVSVDGLSMGDYTRSYTDDLAITTLLWLGWCALSRLRAGNKLSAGHQRQLALVFGLMALFLYPATLGISQLDPYRLGFSAAPLLVVMWAVCTWLWWQRNYLAFALIALATAAYVLDIKDSDNYWDYLIDPILGIYCITHLLACLLRRAHRRFATSAEKSPVLEAEARA